MFAFKAMIALLALPLLAVANPISARGGGGSGLGPGGFNCCSLDQSTATATDCSSISFIPILSEILNSQCNDNRQTVNCANTQPGGLVGVGCVPVSLVL